ncbi:HNH endonuclease signature motif containing protein [Bdellovibrionota bacterium FG-1]
MRLLKEIPEVSAKIEKGSLNLSTVSTVQGFLKREEREKGKVYSAQEKRDLLQQMENRSHRECEKILLQISPESARPKDRPRPVSPTETELKFIASDDLVEKLDQLKGLLAHTHPHLELSQLIELLADRALQQLDPARKKVRAGKEPQASQEAAPVPHDNATPTSVLRRPIPAAIRKQVWTRDGGKCTYIAPETGHKCESRFGLEIDHRTPLAKGGGSDLGSLRLLCKQHNQWEAIRHFGQPQMARFVAGLR